MVDRNLTEAQIKFLKYLIWILLTFLTVATSWTMLEVYRIKTDMPKEYVRLERYQCDQQSIKSYLNKIDEKLDRLIERELDAKENGN